MEQRRIWYGVVWYGLTFVRLAALLAPQPKAESNGKQTRQHRDDSKRYAAGLAQNIQSFLLKRSLRAPDVALMTDVVRV